MARLVLNSEPVRGSISRAAMQAHRSTGSSGDAHNVIPQTAVIRGTFRTISNDTVKQIEECMRRTATGVAAAFGAPAEVEFPDNPEFGIMPRRRSLPTPRPISSGGERRSE
jgi:metal-dependent amidase/aminoacylase/carboxypeptidase family protein